MTTTSLTGDSLEIVKKLSGTSIQKYASAINTQEGTYGPFAADRLVTAYLHYLVNKRAAGNHFHHALSGNSGTKSSVSSPHNRLTTEQLEKQFSKGDAFAKEFWNNQAAASHLRAGDAHGSLRGLLKSMLQDEAVLLEMLTYLAEHADARKAPPPEAPVSAAPKASSISSSAARTQIDVLVPLIPQTVGVFPTQVSEAKGVILNGWGEIRHQDKALSSRDKSKLYAYVYAIDTASVSLFGSLTSSGGFVEGGQPLLSSATEHQKKYGNSPAPFQGVKGLATVQEIATFLSTLNQVREKSVEAKTLETFLRRYSKRDADSEPHPLHHRPMWELEAISMLAQVLQAKARMIDSDGAGIPVSLLEHTLNRGSPFTAIGLPVLASLVMLNKSQPSPGGKSSGVFDDLLSQFGKPLPGLATTDAAASAQSVASPATDVPASSTPDTLRERIRKRRGECDPRATGPSAPPPHRDAAAQLKIIGVGLAGFLSLCLCIVALILTYEFIASRIIVGPARAATQPEIPRSQAPQSTATSSMDVTDASSL